MKNQRYFIRRDIPAKAVGTLFGSTSGSRRLATGVDFAAHPDYVVRLSNTASAHVNHDDSR
jgi:hypothetical protein